MAIRPWFSGGPCFTVVKNSANITVRVDTCFYALRTLNMEEQQGRWRLMEVVRNYLGSKQVNVIGKMIELGGGIICLSLKTVEQKTLTQFSSESHLLCSPLFLQSTYTF